MTGYDIAAIVVSVVLFVVALVAIVWGATATGITSAQKGSKIAAIVIGSIALAVAVGYWIYFIVANNMYASPTTLQPLLNR